MDHVDEIDQKVIEVLRRFVIAQFFELACLLTSDFRTDYVSWGKLPSETKSATATKRKLRWKLRVMELRYLVKAVPISKTTTSGFVPNSLVIGS